jgi:hypothetical protein
MEGPARRKVWLRPTRRPGWSVLAMMNRMPDLFSSLLRFDERH